MKTQKTMKDLFLQERREWLESARAAARKLLKKQYYVTIEDVLKVCPRPTYIHPNTTGHVFNCPDFMAIGWQPSTRPLMNGRQVRRWRINADQRFEKNYRS